MAPSSELCSSCRAAQPVIRIHDSTNDSVFLCVDCLRSYRLRTPDLDLIRFFTLLARPRPAPDSINLRAMDPETTCSRCGLRFADFARTGLTGCEACYDSFAPAI